jgi:broad specificity phosphatase PhoE
VRTVYQEANVHWPRPVVIEELDEYDGQGIVKEFLPVLREQDERIRRLAEANESFYGTADRYKHFQRMVEAVTGKWVEGAHESAKVESWRRFHDRVTGALKQIINSNDNGGRRIAVFTSGGPISVAVQTAMKAPEATALELNWRVRNCSLTEIVFTRDRMNLDAFNMIPHLTVPELLTYR